MKINFKITLITVFVVMTMLLIIANLPMFNVSRFEVIGNIETSEEEIISKVTALEVDNIFWLSKSKLESSVETLPYVKTATIHKSFPNGLQIEVKERQAVAYLVYNKNSYIYIDGEGYVLEVANTPLEGKSLVTGVKYGNFVLGEPLVFENDYVLHKVTTLNGNIQRYELQNYQITIDLLEDFNVKLIINDITVGLGEFQDIDKKMRYLKSILTKLDEQGYMSGYIDLSDFDKPITFKFSAK